jgi:hypothetical protein
MSNWATIVRLEGIPQYQSGQKLLYFSIAVGGPVRAPSAFGDAVTVPCPPLRGVWTPGGAGIKSPSLADLTAASRYRCAQAGANLARLRDTIIAIAAAGNIGLRVESHRRAADGLSATATSLMDRRAGVRPADATPLAAATMVSLQLNFTG